MWTWGVKTIMRILALHSIPPQDHMDVACQGIRKLLQPKASTPKNQNFFLYFAPRLRPFLQPFAKIAVNCCPALRRLQGVRQYWHFLHEKAFSLRQNGVDFPRIPENKKAANVFGGLTPGANFLSSPSTASAHSETKPKSVSLVFFPSTIAMGFCKGSIASTIFLHVLCPKRRCLRYFLTP